MPATRRAGRETWPEHWKSNEPEPASPPPVDGWESYVPWPVPSKQRREPQQSSDPLPSAPRAVCHRLEGDRFEACEARMEGGWSERVAVASGCHTGFCG